MSELPENWVDVPLNELCRPRQWKTISTKDLTPTGYTVYGANGIIGFYSEYTHEKPTLMITCRGATCGNLHISKPFSYINGNAMALDDLLEGVCSQRYLYYFLKNRGFDDVISGSAQPQITREGLSNVVVSVAPLDEQKRIAEKLDSLLARVDSCQTHLERVPQILKRFRQSVLAAAIEGKLGIQNDEFGIGQGQLPEGWRWIDFKEIMQSLKNGFFYGRPAIEPPGIPILRISAVRPMSVNLDEPRFVPDIDEDKVKGYFLEKGDLLFTRYNGNAELVGACGRVRELPKPTIYPDKLIRVKVNHDIVLPEYLEMYFATQTARKFVEGRIKSTAGQHGIAGGDIKSIPVILPPLEEQAEIVRRVEKLFAYAENLEARYLSTSEHVERLTPSLLAKAFRGELVEQNVNDESAEKLLEKITAQNVETQVVKLSKGKKGGKNVRKSK